MKFLCTVLLTYVVLTRLQVMTDSSGDCTPDFYLKTMLGMSQSVYTCLVLLISNISQYKTAPFFNNHVIIDRPAAGQSFSLLLNR